MFKFCIEKRSYNDKVLAREPYDVLVYKKNSVENLLTNVIAYNEEAEEKLLARGIFYKNENQFSIDESSDKILNMLPNNLRSNILRFDDFGISEERDVQAESRKALEMFFNKNVSEEEPNVFERYKQYVDADSLIQCLLDNNKRDALLPYDVNVIVCNVLKDSGIEELVKRYGFKFLGSSYYFDGCVTYNCYIKILCD